MVMCPCVSTHGHAMDISGIVPCTCPIERITLENGAIIYP